jgi:regulation of enolase protein 1 (concanavalin A-like superfamily)
MYRIMYGGLILGVAGLIVSPVISDDRPAQVIEGWGEVADPDGDCTIRQDGQKLTIAIPATKHDLSVEVGDVNAPRVLRNLAGDFIALVKVSGNVRHNGNRTSENYLAYHGAGLLLWLDGQTYIRLERAAVVQDENKVLHYANFELRKDGKRAEMESNSFEIPDGDTYLRLERRGGRIFGSFSDDGIRWGSFDPITVELPKDLKLGVDAINTSTEPFKAEFSEPEVYKKETNAAAR